MTLTKLFKKQKGRCEWCNQPITDEQSQDSAFHTHNIRPRSEGGNNQLGNLRLVHVECHNSLHSQFSRKEMADLINKSIDYLRLMKPVQ